ncbi:polyprenyl diphosphate synthase [Desulfovibrio ferrophilus]|uniref:Isoprenyl transferase n=1 Tax=Desulfovibrio ferrophilus TaxID=241368 RepID=A0A2Z6AZK7_9BACT|nr:polyprenyl diphosphate synthase [Desulfovibrio ferrophilus]BBD08630.1 undecaprenyl diphosphate synthase [Desulfovibrio ferrophilus]
MIPRRIVLQLTSLPVHLAVIMDGNGRWATSRGLTRSEGHRAGTKTARKVVTECRKLGIRHLTLYTFSKENWGRPKEEISFLFDLLKRFLTNELSLLLEQDIRLNILGEINELPLATRKVLQHVMTTTNDCASMTLNLALNYSSRDEIVRAARLLAEAETPPAEFTEEALANRLYTAGQPDPDLIIRTSGEQRLSNYLLFQAAYAEFYFTDTLWPDFDETELHKALETYAGRKRRFGKTGEQAEQDT